MPPDLEPPAATIARRNLMTLFGVSILIGVGVAVYNEMTPLFLKERQLSWRQVGWIYAGGALLVFVIRVGLGVWSDRVGRKRVYVLSLMLSGLVALFTPFGAAAWMQGILRGVGDPAVRAREAMHSVLLFEDSPQRFRKIFSRTRAVEFFFHFLGLVLAAWCVRWMVAHAIAAPLNKGLVAAGVVLLLSAVCFAYFFREHAPRTRGPAPLVWRDLLRPNLPAPLWIMAGGMCIFSLAISTSHCFALQWFFQEKFGASNSDILIVGALHRLFVAIPLLVAGHFIRRRLKFWLVLLVACEGVFVAAPGFMPAADYALVGVRVSALWTAVGVWLLHDVLGMGAWLSAQQELVQRYSRPETRGKDVSLTGALAAVGGIGGPLLAGWLRTWNVFGDGFAVNLPFIVSGMLASTAAIVLLALPDVRSRPT